MNANYLWGKGMDKKDWHTLTPGKEVVNTLPHSPQRAGQLVKAQSTNLVHKSAPNCKHVLGSLSLHDGDVVAICGFTWIQKMTKLCEYII